MLATETETHGGHKLRVARLGSGPPVILLHGYPDNLQIWSELAPRLAARFKVIAFDWPGMGLSEAWTGGATPFDFARRLRTLMDSWSIERAAIIGHDMGGQPALALAAEYPPRISQLVVMNSLVIWDEKTSWEIALLRKFGWNRILLKRMPRAVFWRAIQTFLPGSFKLDAELRGDLWESFQKLEVREFVVRMCAGYQGTLPRLKQLYPSIQSPSLFLWAERDKHFPVSHAKRLAEMVPGAKLEEIPRGGHWMALNLAEEVSTRILRFLGSPSSKDNSAATAALPRKGATKHSAAP
ncbi:MAG TPA: alpha/beta hydrolase [Candidatus Acidoferrum sp.]|nr:alpha/beta hydrolase [Candidatus Acidoferrum sp.]